MECICYAYVSKVEDAWGSPEIVWFSCAMKRRDIRVHPFVFSCTKVAHPRSCHVRAECCVPYADRHACCRWLHVMQIFHYFKYTPIVHWLIVGIWNAHNARLHTLYPLIITARFWHYNFYIYNAVHVTSGLGGFSVFGHCVCQMLPCMSVCFYALCTEECSALNIQNSADQNRILPLKKR